MANEITLSVNAQLVNGEVRAGLNKSVRIDQSAAKYDGHIQVIGTTYEAITIASDIATPGVSTFLNTDDTNYIELGVVVAATFYPFTKLKPGEPQAFRLGTSAPYAKANTAACNLQVQIFAD